MKKRITLLIVFFTLLVAYGLTIWVLKHSGFQFYCVYLVPFLGPFTGLFLPFGQDISEKDVYVLCVTYLIPFLLLVHWKKKLRFVCLWIIWFFLCVISVANWQYAFKASDTYPIQPHQNRLVCWEHLPSKMNEADETKSDRSVPASEPGPCKSEPHNEALEAYEVCPR